MKKEIIIEVPGNNNWAGGLYYDKNIIFQLLQNDYIKSNYRIRLFTFYGNKALFSVFKKSIERCITFNRPRRVLWFIECLYARLHRTKICFPMTDMERNVPNEKKVFWIPDFQHNHLKEFFTADEIKERTELYTAIANTENPILLSSQDALRDFREYYSKDKQNIYVVPFVSYIEEYIKKINDSMIEITLDKHGLDNKKYACCMNQFWAHKNHLTLLKAIDKFVSMYPDREFYFVFTGNPNDYRNPEYIDEVNRYIDKLSDKVFMLGFIDRIEQLIIMKQAEFVIQPSLFEGWGTVVEDAKVLDKTILLSDIPIHKEQANDKCILFDPRNVGELAELISNESKNEHMDDVEKGIRDMYVRAKEYSKGFEQLLKDVE